MDDIVNMQKMQSPDKAAGADPIGDIADEGFEKLLGGHIIGPLITEYENHLKAQTREISTLKTALRQ